MGEVEISEKLLEAIVRGEVIGPEHLDPEHAVDRYILEFCGWNEVDV